MISIILCAYGRTQRQSENWKIWIRKHSIFWKSQQSHMTLHVLSVAKSMAIQTANIRKEGMPIVKEFLADTGMSEAQIERVAYLVGHHHTLKDIEGIDYQILIEADYIVNAYESEYSKENIENFIEKVMKTDSGKRITREVFCL